MFKCSFCPLLLVSTSFLFACSSDSDDCNDSSRVFAGSIEVSELEDSAQLAELECVRVVTGDLTISDPKAESLNSLSSLVQVLGDFTIRNNEKLSSLDGLEQLAEVGGNLSLDGLGKLEALDGLGALKTVGGNLSISNNSRLVMIDGLKALSSINGTFELSGNAMLTSASLLRRPSFKSIVVVENQSLRRLEQFGSPISNDEPRFSYNGFADIKVSFNDSLEELELPHVKNANVEVSNCPTLTTISVDLSSGSVDAAVVLSELPSLKNVNFHNWFLTSLEIRETGLETLDALDANGVACDLAIFDNPSLKNISTLANRTGLVAGTFSVHDNPALPSCQARTIANALPATDRHCQMKDGLTQGSRVIDIRSNDEAAICE